MLAAMTPLMDNSESSGELEMLAGCGNSSSMGEIKQHREKLDKRASQRTEAYIKQELWAT